MKRFAVLTVLVCGFFVAGAFASAHKCPSCNGDMVWTGETKTEWGTILYLHKCAASHQYWFKTIADSKSNKSSSDSTSSRSSYGTNYGSSYGSSYGNKKSEADENSQSKSRFSSDKDSECPVCGRSLTWTGKTKTEWGKLLKIYKCTAGHECVGK